MNSKERRLEKQRQRREREAAEARAQELGVEFETPAQANSALAEQARVINMQDVARKQQPKKLKVERDEKGRVKLPPLPKSSKPKPQRPCECGCGDLTKSRFAPGHDSHLRGWVIRVERGIVKLSDLKELGVSDGQIAVIKKQVAERKKEAAAGADEASNG